MRAFRFAAISLAMSLVAACAVLAATFASAHAAGQDTLEIVTSSGVHAFSVEMATNDAERSRGLMFRKELPEGHGMLFDFQTEQSVAFWMHNTYIPLDMIFIAPSGVVTHIAANAEPLSERVIPSGGPSIGVLELNGGMAASIGLKVGDKVRHPFFKP